MAPPSARKTVSGLPSASITSTMSHTWWATASTAARATWARVLPLVSPVTEACTVRSQCGAPSPVKAGTRITPALLSTWAASSTRSETCSRPSRSAVQASVEPEDKMLPSRAKVGWSVSQASVAGTGESPPTKAATGVITDVPVP